VPLLQLVPENIGLLNKVVSTTKELSQLTTCQVRPPPHHDGRILGGLPIPTRPRHRCSLPNCHGGRRGTRQPCGVEV